MTPLSALPIAAAALSLPLAWRTPAHRPLAVALVATQALEAARPELLPAFAWGALLALPALSAWAVRRTLLGRSADAWGRWNERSLAKLICFVPLLGVLFLPWSGWWPLALAAGVAAQGAAWWRWRVESPWREAAPTASELAAITLAFGDAGGLLVGLAAGWAAVGWWAAAVAAVLVGVQARALWRAWR